MVIPNPHESLTRENIGANERDECCDSFRGTTLEYIAGPFALSVCAAPNRLRTLGYMLLPRQETVKDWAKAVALWCGLAVSLGVYYRFAAAAGGGWVLPFPEALAATLLYHFSTFEAGGAAQAIEWLSIVCICGLLWVAILSITAPFFDGRKALFSATLVRSGVAALPISLGGLWLLYRAGHTPTGWRWGRMMDVAMGYQSVRPWEYLNYLYAGLAIVGLAMQLRLFMTAFDVKGVKALGHFATGLVLLTLVACGLGVAGSMVLRMWFGAAG